MKKASLLIAAIMLSAGTSFAQSKSASVRAQDRNIARDNKADCGRLQQTDLFANTNPPASSSAPKKGSAKSGRD